MFPEIKGLKVLTFVVFLFFFQLTVNDAETTLSEALNEGVDMGTLFYIVGTQTTLGLKGKSFISHCSE